MAIPPLGEAPGGNGRFQRTPEMLGGERCPFSLFPPTGETWKCAPPKNCQEVL
ncbi:hypothetical protein EBI_25585 [Enterocytozoon bieneusi H348]|nr:hypothetical protein EBI_25585 [Enterocytozoon bieneusi H348]|eukprot:XP_002651905.1 hypothetical protein EBI_25585 [Enterocytozoon bieneusi H348]